MFDPLKKKTEQEKEKLRLEKIRAEEAINMTTSLAKDLLDHPKFEKFKLHLSISQQLVEDLLFQIEPTDAYEYGFKSYGLICQLKALRNMKSIIENEIRRDLHKGKVPNG